jgi:hypothetical protein
MILNFKYKHVCNESQQIALSRCRTAEEFKEFEAMFYSSQTWISHVLRLKMKAQGLRCQRYHIIPDIYNPKILYSGTYVLGSNKILLKGFSFTTDSVRLQGIRLASYKGYGLFTFDKVEGGVGTACPYRKSLLTQDLFNQVVSSYRSRVKKMSDSILTDITNVIRYTLTINKLNDTWVNRFYHYEVGNILKNIERVNKVGVTKVTADRVVRSFEPYNPGWLERLYRFAMVIFVYWWFGLTWFFTLPEDNRPSYAQSYRDFDFPDDGSDDGDDDDDDNNDDFHPRSRPPSHRGPTGANAHLQRVPNAPLPNPLPNHQSNQSSSELTTNHRTEKTQLSSLFPQSDDEEEDLKLEELPPLTQGGPSSQSQSPIECGFGDWNQNLNSVSDPVQEIDPSQQTISNTINGWIDSCVKPIQRTPPENSPVSVLHERSLPKDNTDDRSGFIGALTGRLNDQLSINEEKQGILYLAGKPSQERMKHIWIPKGKSSELTIREYKPFKGKPAFPTYSYQITSSKSLDPKMKQGEYGVLVHTPGEPEVPQKRIAQLWPMLKSIWIMHRNTTANAIKSFTHRQCLDNGCETEREQLAYYNKFLKEIFLKYLPQCANKLDTYDWIGTRKHFSAGKRNLYYEAYFNCWYRPFQILEASAFKTKSLFCKCELMGKTVRDPARTINARKREIQCILAPIVQMMTYALKHAWNHSPHWNNIKTDVIQNLFYYTSGLDRNQMGDLVNTILGTGDYQFLGIDFSKFDASQTQDFIENEYVYYAHMLGKGTDLDLMKRLVDYGAGTWKTVSKSYLDGGFALMKCTATRSSGDPQTTFTNTILNASLIAFALYDIYGPQILEEARILVCGDDSLTFIPRKYTVSEKQFREVLRKLGWKITLQHSEILSQVEYCSSFFVRVTDNTYNKETHYLHPKLGNLLSKTSLSTKDVSFERQCDYASEKALGFLNELYLYPQLHRYIGRRIATYKQFAVRAGLTYFKYLSNNNKIIANDYTYMDVANRYGGKPIQLIEFLNHMEHLPLNHRYIQHSFGELICAVDLAHFTEEEWREFETFSREGETENVSSTKTTLF